MLENPFCSTDFFLPVVLKLLKNHEKILKCKKKKPLSHTKKTQTYKSFTLMLDIVGRTEVFGMVNTF